MVDSYFLTVAPCYDTTEVVLIDRLANMSSNTKDPLEKQDTSTESDESHSEKELEKAEGNLEHLKIEASKDDFDESKAVDSPNQEDTSSSSGDLFNKIFAEQRGLQKPQLERPQGSSYPEFKAASLTDPSKEKEQESKDIDENIGAKMVEEDSHRASEKDIEPTIYENYPPRMEEGESHLSKKEVEPTIYENFSARMEEGDPNTTCSTPPFCQSSTGVTPTSMLQEISPVTEPNRVRGDVDFAIPLGVIAAPFLFKSPHQGSSSKGFDHSNDSENTSADVSEIHSEIVDISTEGSVYQDASEIIEMNESPSYASAVERQSPDNSDTDISDIQDYFPPPPTPASSSISASNPSGMPESMEGEPISGDAIMQVCDKPFEQERQSVENREEMNLPEDARKRTSASRLLVQKSVQVCDVEGSPSKRRRSSKDVSGSSTEEKGLAHSPRSRFKQDTEKRCKMATSKPAALQSTSECPEPKSSSSDELHRMEFPESKSLSEAAQVASKSKKGPLPTVQHSMVLSKDSVTAAEGEDRASALRQQDVRLMETKVATRVRMETMAVKGGQGAAERKELSWSKPSTSSDQAYGSQAEGALMGHEESIKDFQYEGSIQKSKREPKLNKKGRPDQMPTRRTRHDSGDPDMPRVSHGILQHSESTSPHDVSDSTISPSEEETQL